MSAPSDRKTARGPGDLPGLHEVASQSGLDFMRDMLAGRLAGPPIGDSLGFALANVEKGRVTFEGVASFHTANPMGGTHGGWYGAILDSCMGCAVMTEVPKGSVYTTLEYKVNIIRALPFDTPVRAVGEVSHAGRSTAVARGEVRGIGDEKLYATGTTTCLIMAM